MKKLSHLLKNVEILEQFGASDADICSICFDSRAAKPNSLFFALPGAHADGRDFIKSALEKGASAVVFEGEANFLKEFSQGAAFLRVKSARQAMSPISAAFFEFPSKKMRVYGITGTEGKSSTAAFLWQILRGLGIKSGFFSTVEFSLGGEAQPNPEHQTTPEAPIVQEKLAAMREQGCQCAVVEASSHGLSKELGRLADVDFCAAAFMNVKHEHLEFHKTFEKYRSDKANLFRALNEGGFAAVNLDDESARYFAESTKAAVAGFSMGLPKQVPQKIDEYFAATDISESSDGVSAKILQFNRQNGNFAQTGEFPLRLSVLGAFNVYNALAASILASKTENADFARVLRLCESLSPVKGRMTKIDCGQDFELVVDYAHTPSSFEMLFPPIRKRAKGRLIAVFGSAGERDTQKRPMQGEIASKFADIIVLAEEDPRLEDSMQILREIAAGCKKKREGESLFLIPDRPSAIRKAISLARKGDVVLLLGKGHENSIIRADGAHPYDEICEARAALAELAAKPH